MISRLRGKVADKEIDRLVVDVHGVGYDVMISLQTQSSLPEEGEEVTLYIHTRVREDAIQLLGFSTALERQLFLMLVQVNGVGPRVALNILSGISASEFAETMKSENIARLTAIPGIGKKTAQRLIVELRDKVMEMSLGMVAEEVSAANKLKGQLKDLHSALCNMGYKSAQVDKVVTQLKADAESGTDLGTLVREGLRLLNER